jgi:hypothetical protein
LLVLNVPQNLRKFKRWGKANVTEWYKVAGCATPSNQVTDIKTPCRLWWRGYNYIDVSN